MTQSFWSKKTLGERKAKRDNSVDSDHSSLTEEIFANALQATKENLDEAEGSHSPTGANSTITGFGNFH